MGNNYEDTTDARTPDATKGVQEEINLETARLLAEMSKDSVKINLDVAKGQLKSIEVKTYGVNEKEASDKAASGLNATLRAIDNQIPGLIPAQLMERVHDDKAGLE